jgi:hypothetical protein
MGCRRAALSVHVVLIVIVQKRGKVVFGLRFLVALVMKRGPKFVRRVYRKSTHTGRYQHFKSNHPHHVTRTVVHGLISRAEVICQNEKGFNKDIKNIRHDLMLNEYPQEFMDSIMKPWRSNRLCSDTIYQGTAIIPYVKGTSDKFRRIGNRFNVRTIFKTKHNTPWDIDEN